MSEVKTSIRMEGVTKVYSTAAVDTYALSQVDLVIYPGEYVCIQGPSGCGKSTLLSIAGLLDFPTAGRCWVRDQPVERLGPSQRAKIRNREIGFVFQDFNLIGELTAYHNVELPLIYRKVDKAVRTAEVERALDRVQMTNRIGHYPFQLSGGQQQRIAVARAIVGHPSILLADEPTGNLDSEAGDRIMSLLENLHDDGTTIVMVTHNTKYACFADRHVHLFDGRVVG